MSRPRCTGSTEACIAGSGDGGGAVADLELEDTSCISASGSYAFADAYVDAVPSNCTWIQRRLIERNGCWYTPKTVTGSSNCRTGYYSSSSHSAYMTPGLRYFHEVCVSTNAGATFCSDSPEVWR